MTQTISQRRAEPWRRRLFLPNYRVREAARYAKISSQTVAAWHRTGSRQVLRERDKHTALSYLQLIEVVIVAAFRGAGVSLREIRESREYVSAQLKSEYPFAEHRFKTDGRKLFMDLQDFEAGASSASLVRVGMRGQLAWSSVIGRLQEFEYEHEGIAIRWHVAGANRPIVIDPRISFGAPAVKGTPTWVVRGRWEAGESVEDIADDFNLSQEEVHEALKFEGVISREQPDPKWIN